MNILAKIISFFVILTIVIIAGAAAFVHFYITDDRIKSLVVPQAEKALGRSISVGDISVGIFSGITISDFTVKERDKQTTFLQTDKFVLSYNLVPLLSKKLVISEILLDKPSVRVVRDKDGNFNFNTLAFLALAAQQGEKQEKTSPASTTVSIPLALTVETIRVQDAALSFVDNKKELPDTNATTNINIALDIGMDLNDIKFSGEIDSTAAAKYDEITLLAQVNSTFSQDELLFNVDLDADKEKVSLDGKVSHFLSPNIVFNLTSKKLNLDRLMVIAGVLPKSDTSVNTMAAPKENKSAGQKNPTAIASSLPKGLHTEGKIAIERAIYKKLPINNFLLLHDLTDGIFSIKDLSAQSAGGALQSTITIDLNRADPEYNGSIALNSIELSSLGKGLEQGFADIISGELQSKLRFDGSGITPEAIKKSLSADASYSLNNGQIKNSSVTQTIANITGLPELREVFFNDMVGSVKLVKGGIIELVSSVTGTDFQAESKGQVNLDGQINLPIVVKLSEALSKKLDSKGTVTKFLANEKGETELRLKVAGLISAPKTSLDSAGVQQQMTDTLKTKALDELGRFMDKQDSSTAQEGDSQKDPAARETPATQLLKGLFGQ